MPLRMNHKAETHYTKYDRTGKAWCMNTGDIPCIPTAGEVSHSRRWRCTFMRSRFTDDPSSVNPSERVFGVDPLAKDWICSGEAAVVWWVHLLLPFRKLHGPETMNYARFVSRNPSCVVPYGTTSNEAFHNELKGFFTCVLTPTQRFVRTHARVVTLIKLLSLRLKSLDLSKKSRQSALLRDFCVALEDEPARFHPLFDISVRYSANVNVDSLDDAARVVRKRPSCRSPKVVQRRPATTLPMSATSSNGQMI